MPVEAGSVSLGLNLDSKNIGKQVQSAAASAQKEASSAFSGAGTAAAKAIGEPVKKASSGMLAAIRRDCSSAISAYSMLGKAAYKAISSAFRRKQKTQDESVPAQDHGDWQVAAGGTDLLNQKLDITYAKLGEQESKLKRLLEQYAELGNAGLADSHPAMRELDSQITAVQGHIVSLQENINQTQSKISRAASAAAVEEQKTSSRIGDLSKKSGSSIGSAFGHGSKAAGNALKSVEQKFAGLTKSIKSAFKSAFLMAGVYAAFRGIKSLMGAAAKQNMQFANTLAGIKTNLTAAFVPIANTVMPYINTLMGGIANLSARLTAATAQMFGTTVAKSTAAAKRLQAIAQSTGNSTSIDQLNVIDATRGDPAKAATASADQVTASMSELAGKVGPFVAKVAGALAKSAPAFAAGIAAVLLSLLHGINTAFPDFQAAGMAILRALLSGAWQLVPEVGPLVVNIISLLLESFLTYTPQLLAMGIRIITDILSGMASKLPDMAGAAVNIVVQLTSSLADNLPALVQAAADMCLALVQGIVLQGLPLIVEQGPQIVMRLVQGIGDSLRIIMDAAVDIIMTLVDYIFEHPDQLISAGIQMTAALYAGLLRAAGELVAGIGKLIGKIVNKIINTDWKEVGRKILNGIWTGFKDAAKSVTSILGSLFGKSGSSTGTVSVPKFASGGIVSGPTLGMIGEYSGARSDPEVVAPLSHLRGMLGDAGGADGDRLQQLLQLLQMIEQRLGAYDLTEIAALLRDILQWLKSHDFNIRLYADDREIARSNRRGEKQLGAVIAK